jgi:hypothetical protein
MGREDGLVLPAEAVSDLPGESSQNLPLRIDEKPVAASFLAINVLMGAPLR